MASTGGFTDLHAPVTLDALLHPRSIAIVGASGRVGNPFAAPLRNLRRHGFEGAVFPVNPAYAELEGWTCYPTLDVVPETPELAMIMLPAAGVNQAIEQCGRRGTRLAIVSSSGFAEAGAAGRARQDALDSTAREAGVRILGPNCQGVLSVGARMAATFSPALSGELGPEGAVGFVGQSGAVGGAVIDLAREAGLGLAEWVTTGNQMDIDVVEVGNVMLGLPHIRTVMMYAEAPVDGAAFIAIARRAAVRGKRLVVLRSGRSASGRRAIASHTGAMLGTDAAFDVVARREGVVVVDDVDELLRAAHVLTAHRPAGRRVAVVTTSGGAGGLAADHLEQRGLLVAELPAAVQATLAESIPDYGATANPVDVTAQLFSRDSHAFLDVCEVVGGCDEVDQLAVVLTMLVGAMAETVITDVITLAARLGKPVHLVWLAGIELTHAGRQLARAAGLPVYPSLGSMAAAAARLSDAVERIAVGSATRPPEFGGEVRDLLAGPLVLESGAGDFLDAIGVRRPESALARNREQTIAAARRIGGLVAVKIQLPEFPHKSDVNGVRLGLDAEQAGAVWTEFAAAFGPEVPVLVQAMVPPGVELVLGVTSSPGSFPPLITVGLGGVATEIYHDIVSRPAPVTVAEARTMLGELAAAPLLAGFRGRPAVDLGAAADVVARVSAAADALGPSLAELEINPLVVSVSGATVADFLARFEDPRKDLP